MHGSKVKTCQAFLWAHIQHRCSGYLILINTQLLTESYQLTLVFAFEFTSGRLSKCVTVSVLWYMHATRSGEYSLDPWRRWIICFMSALQNSFRRYEKWEEKEKGDEKENCTCFTWLRKSLLFSWSQWENSSRSQRRTTRLLVWPAHEWCNTFQPFCWSEGWRILVGT